MNAITFQDPRTNDLLSRVGDDVSMLRQDVANLFTHTTRRALPNGARRMANNARGRLHTGRLYTAEHLQALKNTVQNGVHQPAAAWIGGAAAVGLLAAAGAYMLFRNGHHNGQGNV